MSSESGYNGRLRIQFLQKIGSGFLVEFGTDFFVGEIDPVNFHPDPELWLLLQLLFGPRGLDLPLHALCQEEHAHGQEEQADGYE